MHNTFFSSSKKSSSSDAVFDQVISSWSTSTMNADKNSTRDTKTDTSGTDTDVIMNLGEFWQEWSRCITFQHQRDHLYRLGTFDDCSVQWNDYTAVLAVKFTNDVQKAKHVIQSTTLYQNKKAISPTVGVIWEAKDTPSWD
jgi:hypothetical protein